MPRRRATKAQTERAKPKLSSTGDEINGMSRIAREERLATFMKDFDITVENLRKKYAENLIEQERLIEEGFHVIKLKLSKGEKMLPLMQYLEEKMAEEEEEKENEVAELPMAPKCTTFSDTQSVVQQTLSKYRSRAVIDTIPEDDSVMKSASRTSRKKGASGKSVMFNGANPTPQSSRYITPAMQRSMQCLDWGATPAVTPKFNPRLPITPGLKREPKPGEILMSLAGSPIEIEKTSRKQPRRAQGKTLEIQMPEDDEYKALFEDLEIPDTIDMSNLPDNKFRQMMNTFAQIIKKGGSS